MGDIKLYIVAVTFLAGAAVGIVAGTILESNFGTTAVAIDECQRSLPRDEICVVVTVPLSLGSSSYKE